MSDVFTIEELARLVDPILQRYGASGASLFGSYARGEATPDSDIDLIVLGGPTFDRRDVFSIAEDLYEEAGKPVDVYEESELNPASEFYRSVKRDELKLV
ncbi:MAG: nucleotidyltransferase domain-containing protein [Olegusella sp.]|nr:nucleotidyltransferase domain-containing protein [Olegusella sp.]